MTLGCYGCDTGTAKHHQNGAKSWIQCECGKFVGQQIDMSDTFHAKKALEAWDRAAQEYVTPKEVSLDPVDVLANTNTDFPPKKKTKKYR